MILARGSELLRERLRRPQTPTAVRSSLEAAISWLYAAQDAPGDGGVSHSFLVGDGWMRSYPETTGYIIPTLLNWSLLAADDEAARRALRMADWEIGVQLSDGAVPDLRDGRGVVFDTGQVIFGWVAAHEHTAERCYLEAAQRGAQWLLEGLDEGGVWRAANDAGGPGRVYNARVAWALLELDRVAHDGALRTAARRFLDWTLAQERGEGWFANNCLTDDAAPLLHTIAYTARGQLESGLRLGERRYVDAARRTAASVAARVREDGFLAGRFDPSWRPAVSWACLTGMAQMCIVWRRLARALESEPDSGEMAAFGEAARRVSSFLVRTQDRSSGNPGLRGGIRGSYPINGDYGRWRVLNWATKFFADALMLELFPGDRRYLG